MKNEPAITIGSVTALVTATIDELDRQLTLNESVLRTKVLRPTV